MKSAKAVAGCKHRKASGSLDLYVEVINLCSDWCVGQRCIDSVRKREAKRKTLIPFEISWKLAPVSIKKFLFDKALLWEFERARSYRPRDWKEKLRK